MTYFVAGRLLFGESGSLDLSGATIVAAEDVRAAVVQEFEATVETEEVEATVETETVAAVDESENKAEVEC